MGSIVAKAKEVCAIVNTDQPFMCLDLTYIAILLKDGYDLNMETNIKVRHTDTPHREDNIFTYDCKFLFLNCSSTERLVVTKHRGR